MQTKTKLAVLSVFVFLLSAGFAAAVPTVACNDSVDNDGDGLVDGNDPSCEKPYYADDSETLIYDKDASWVWAGSSAPSDSGPTAFYGSKVVEDGSSNPDSGSSDTLTEYYVENPGSEGSDDWGSGVLSSTSISISGAETTSGPEGDELIDTPNSGSCGDGKKDSGETPSSCPQDAGLVDTETLESEPSPDRDLEYSEPSGTHTFTASCNVDDGGTYYNKYDQIDGSVSGEPDYYIGGFGYDIKKETTDNNHKLAHSHEHDETTDLEGARETYESSTDEVDIVTGTDSTNTGTFCTSVEKRKLYTANDLTDTKDTSVEDYDTGTYNSQTLTTEIDYVEAEKTDEYYICTETKEWDTECDGETQFNDNCTPDTKDYYPVKDPARKLDPYHSKDGTCTYGVEYQNFWVDTNTVFEVNKDTSFDDYSSGEIGNNPGDGYYTTVSSESREQGNDESQAFARYQLNNAGSNFEAVKESGKTVDVDGYQGQSDGFVAYDEDVGITGASNSLLEKELVDGSTSNYIGMSSLPALDCPAGYSKCIASVDVEPTSGWSGSNGGYQFDFVQGNPFGPGASMGACKMYKDLSGDTDMDCNVDNEVCGDEHGEATAYLEGPEVDEAAVPTGHKEGCVKNSNYDSCVLPTLTGTETVKEGYIANISDPADLRDYEEGGNVADREICLNIDGGNPGGTGDDVSGDNYDYDDDGTVEEAGGEWYDMDSDVATSYLRGGGSSLVSSSSNVDSNEDGSYNERDVDYYYTTNPNPQHSTFNPQGGREGLALEDDCGPDVDGCDESGATIDGKLPSFFTTFTEGERDEDFNPLSKNTEKSNSEFYGFFNRIDEESDQLEDSMDTEVSPSDPIWQTSLYNRSISNTSIDQYAVTKNLSKLVSARGNVYSPGNTYLRSGVSARTSSDDPSHNKTERVFANSFADVSTYINGDIDIGDGVWIDPDYVKEGWDTGEYSNNTYFSSWRDKLTYRMDITGPDTGLGFDIGGSGHDRIGTGNPDTDIVVGDIYFEGENDGLDNDGDGSVDESETYDGTNIVGETTPKLEPPMCGDDSKEFLLEEMGEAEVGARYDGRYACADSFQKCVDMGSTPEVVDSGEYRNMNEPDEDIGRAKNDLEVCGQADVGGTSDPKYRWIDQDLVENYCRENTYFGEQGIRWFDSGYVDSYPEAVKYGVDDDWNDYMENESKSTASSPVANGNPDHNKIRSKGFCGGDDEGEFFITQKCTTRLCETDNSVMGVVKTPGACILDRSKYSAVSGNERDTYRPGEEVTFDYGGGETRKIRCLNGRWYSEWPIAAEKDNMEISNGETETVSFYLVNPTSNKLKFDLNIEDTAMKKFSEFKETDSDTMSVNVKSQSTKRVGVESIGGKLSIDNEPVRVQAIATNADLSGEAETSIDVVNAPTGAGSKETNDVPGIGVIQLLAAALTAATVVMFS